MSTEAVPPSKQGTEQHADEEPANSLNPGGIYDHLTMLQQLHIHWNKLRVQYWQDSQYEKSVGMAERMLRERDLPIYYRAQCYLTLATFDITATHASTHAATAVSILDDMKAAGAPIKDSTYKNACDILAEAKEMEGRFKDDQDSQDEDEPVTPASEKSPEVQDTLGADSTRRSEEHRPRTRSRSQQALQEGTVAPASPSMLSSRE